MGQIYDVIVILRPCMSITLIIIDILQPILKVAPTDEITAKRDRKWVMFYMEAT